MKKETQYVPQLTTFNQRKNLFLSEIICSSSEKNMNSRGVNKKYWGERKWKRSKKKGGKERRKWIWRNEKKSREKNTGWKHYEFFLQRRARFSFVGSNKERWLILTSFIEGVAVQWLGHWISISKVRGLKPSCGFTDDTAPHPLEVYQMSSKNSYGLGG